MFNYNLAITTLSRKIYDDISACTKLAINAPKDGRGINQKQVLEQNLSSTDVHGRTSVERYTDAHS